MKRENKGERTRWRNERDEMHDKGEGEKLRHRVQKERKGREVEQG